MDKQCSSCGGFCGEVCEREDVEPNLLNQTCCECGRSGGFALYCGWCWSKGDKPVADVNTSEERVPISDKQGHECQELKASEPIGEIIEAHGLIAVSIPEMPPVGTKLYAAPPKREWVTLSDDDIKEIVGNWGDTPIRGYTRKLFDEIDLMYRKRNQAKGEEHMTETEAVINWVLQGNARKRKTINRKVSSYGLKHTVERDVGQYIGNDSFIEAMNTLGFKKEQIKGTPNYFFGIHLEKNNA